MATRGTSCEGMPPAIINSGCAYVVSLGFVLSRGDARVCVHSILFGAISQGHTWTGGAVQSLITHTHRTGH